MLATIACQHPSPATDLPAPIAAPASTSSAGGGAPAAPAAAPALTEKWTQVAANSATAQPAARRDHTLTVDSDRGVVYLFGGRAGSFGAMDDLWAFDAKAAAWRQIAVRGAQPPARFGHNAFYDAARKRLLIAVGQASATQFFNDVWAFDPDGGTWRELATGAVQRPALRYGAGGAANGSGGGFLISHGFTDTGRFDDSWSFDPSSDRWSKVTATGSTPERRCLTQGFWDAQRGQFLLFGGQSNTAPFLGDFWSLDTARGVWAERKVAVLPGPRNLFGAAEDVSALRWYLFGGNTPDGPTADVWVFDAVREGWSMLAATASDGPSGRQGADIAVWSDRMMLFGGNDGKADHNDTWTLEMGRGN